MFATDTQAASGAAGLSPAPARWRRMALLVALGTALASGAQAADFKALGVVSRPLMQTTTTWAGQPLQYPPGEAEVIMTEITVAPGAETGWHSHPVSSFAYVLEGELEVSLEDGRTHRVKRGQTLAEVVGLNHNGRNVGEGPVKLVVFYTSTPGTALTRLRP